jgi:hypothetical protein
LPHLSAGGVLYSAGGVAVRTSKRAPMGLARYADIRQRARLLQERPWQEGECMRLIFTNFARDCLKIPDKPRKGPYEPVKRGGEARLPPVWGTRAHDLEAL